MFETYFNPSNPDAVNDKALWYLYNQQDANGKAEWLKTAEKFNRPADWRTALPKTSTPSTSSRIKPIYIIGAIAAAYLLFKKK